jgi:hypothetical protein
VAPVPFSAGGVCLAVSRASLLSFDLRQVDLVDWAKGQEDGFEVVDSDLRAVIVMKSD